MWLVDVRFVAATTEVAGGKPVMHTNRQPTCERLEQYELVVSYRVLNVCAFVYVFLCLYCWDN